MARATRIALDLALASSKSLRPTLGHVWQYTKTEVAPPMTLSFFHGPGGKYLENCVSKFADGIMDNIENRIKKIDAEELRIIKEKEAAIKVAQEKAKAATKAKEEERKRQEEQKKKEKVKVAQAKAKEGKKLRLKLKSRKIHQRK
ncbi:uncharacterized protein ACR2FA_012220 [Aphomia sociella]